MGRFRTKGDRKLENLKNNRGQVCSVTPVNRKLYRVEIRALNGCVTRNGWQYTNLQEHLAEFRNIPILISYPEDGAVIGGGHDFDVKIDPDTGQEYASFTSSDTERIVGWVPGPGRLEVVKGKQWIVVTGYLWRWYAKELVDKIAAQPRGMEVSIETLILREHRDGEVMIEEDWTVLGVTVLGDGVPPAVPGAGIRKLSRLTEPGHALTGSVKRMETRKETMTGGNMQLTNRFISAMENLFPGFRCVGAGEDKRSVALMAGDGSICIAAVPEDTGAEAAAPETPVAVEPLVIAEGRDGSRLEFSYDRCLSILQQKQEELEQAGARLTEQNGHLQAQVDKMVREERQRRLDAARDAVADELERRNRNRSPERCFPQSLCQDLLGQIESGAFTDRVNDKGLWTGEAEVRGAVAALCMDEQSRQDAQEAQKLRTCRSWSAFSGEVRPAGTVGDRLAG